MRRRKPKPKGLKFHDIPDQAMAQRLETAVLRYSDAKKRKTVITREMSGWKKMVIKALEGIGSSHVDLGNGRFVKIEMKVPKKVVPGKPVRLRMKFEVKS